MHAAQLPILPGSPFGEFAGYFEPVPRRLLACVALSALVLAIGIATIDMPLRFDFWRWLPAVLEVTLPEHRPAPAVEPEEAPAAATPRPATPTEEPRSERAAARPGEAPAADTAPAAAPVLAQPDVDWYAALESAAAGVGEEYATPASLHAEFDELRRIARERYGPPETGKAPPIRENVEEDIYGRKLLRLGENCYRVLDDPNVGNRYAFETFEKDMLFCAFGIGKRKPENLPWVEIIRAKYQHLRDPDGSRSAAGAHPP